MEISAMYSREVEQEKEARTNVQRSFDVASAVDSYLERLDELLLGSEEPESEEDEVGGEELLRSDL